MTRALFVISDLEMGGAQRVVLTVVRHLNRNGLHTELALLSEEGPLSGEIPEIPVHKLRAGRVRHSFFKLLRLCRSLKPDFVVSTVGHLNILLLLLKSILPRHTSVIVREANTPSIRLRHTRHPYLYRLAYKTLYPLSDRIICNCNSMKEDLTSHFGFPPNRITVIPNPVDVERVSMLTARADNPYEGDEIKIASIGRMDHQKGFDLLLKALGRARETIPNLKTTLVGDGPRREELRSLAADLGVADAVRFVGLKENPYPYMACSDFVVSSSRWEGSPNVVLESLACGTPVLAFDCPGGTGEIIREGENGWLVPAENWQAMGRKMVEIVSARGWSGMKGRILLPEKYLCEKVVAQWEELLRTAKANGGRKS